MNIVAYLKSLLPFFGKDHLTDDVARLRADVDDNLLPSLEQAARAFHGQRFKSSVAQGLEETLRNRFQAYRHLGLFELLAKLFAELPAKLDVVEKVLEASFAQDVAREALTFRQANVLKLLETLSFAVEYATKVTHRVLAAEAMMEAKLPDAVDSHLTSAQRAYFSDKYGTWLDALVVVNEPVGTWEGLLMAVPDVVVEEGSESGSQATFGAKRLDPLGLNFIAPSWNPIYRVRMVRAEWDVARINQAKEERKLVELRLHDLKNKREGHPNAHLEHQIELTEDRLKKIDFKVAKLSGVAA